MLNICKSFGCSNPTHNHKDFCIECEYLQHQAEVLLKQACGDSYSSESMAEKYPAYYKSVSHLSEVDVYAIHQLFDIQDPSGAIQHASKKLLLSGVRTGGKSPYQDIKEARDTLNRWLELNQSK